MLWLPHDIEVGIKKYENINKNKNKNINLTDNFKWGPVLSQQLTLRHLRSPKSLLDWWQEERWFHENRLSLAVENVVGSSQ